MCVGTVWLAGWSCTVKVASTLSDFYYNWSGHVDTRAGTVVYGAVALRQQGKGAVIRKDCLH